MVIYGHSVKYSYEIPNKYLPGSMVASLLAYIAIFSDSFIFGKATSSRFLRIDFFKVSQELIFQRSPFFMPFLGSSHFFPAIFPRNIYLFIVKRLPRNQTLKNRKFFSATIFQNSYPEKASTEELLFRSRFFCATSNFSKKARF